MDLRPKHFNPKKSIREDYAKLGRNCKLFEVGRFYAYGKVHGLASQRDLHKSVYRYIKTYNGVEFFEPLPAKEVQGIAKSTSKWTWRNRSGIFGGGRYKRKTDDAGIKKIRQANAYNTHEVRKAATEEKIKNAIDKFLREGRRISKAAVAREAGISRQAINRYYKHLF